MNTTTTTGHAGAQETGRERIAIGEMAGRLKQVHPANLRAGGNSSQAVSRECLDAAFKLETFSGSFDSAPITRMRDAVFRRFAQEAQGWGLENHGIPQLCSLFIPALNPPRGSGAKDSLPANSVALIAIC